MMGISDGSDASDESRCTMAERFGEHPDVNADGCADFCGAVRWGGARRRLSFASG